MKITDPVFLVPGVGANPFLILDADGLTLIDAGLPRSDKKKPGLHRQPIASQPRHHLLVTSSAF